jgi:tetratricopeptide (TPR) repeat protein
MARSRFPAWLVAVLLALVTLALYWPVTRYDFINCDDDLFVTSNVHVQNGLTLANIKWAFLNPVADNWHPLTVLSHMLVCQVFGLKPWGHHLINVLLHALNATLVFTLLRRMTGVTWRSLLVAALFAVHPLRVESVAWVSERKDVLSGFFGLLSLIAYARYAQRTGMGSQESELGKLEEKTISALAARHSALGYGFALFFFALGLMSKPMLVTWPFVMLLLDYWPLERFKRNSGWRLVAEKIPFFALAALASVVTLVVQKRGGSLALSESLPFDARAENTLVSYCRHLGKMFWPTDLAVLYPHPGYWPIEKVLLAGGLLLGISVLLLVNRQRYPFLLMGWLWFCGMLVPVIGLVQTGSQAMADRHSYIPSLGVLILAIWGACEVTRRRRYQVVALSVAGCAAVVLCFGLTRQQLGYWKDSESLFRHALKVTENNYLAHLNLGTALGMKGQIDEAISQFQETIRLKPDYADAHFNLGATLGMKGQVDEAVKQFQEAIRLNPDHAKAHYYLGITFDRKGQIDEAISQYQETIRLKPGDADTHFNLGNALLQKEQTGGAILCFQRVLAIQPTNAVCLNNLAWIRAAHPQAEFRDGAEAVRLAEKACRLTGYQEAVMVGTLAAAYAEAGRFEEAVATAQKARELALALGQEKLAEKNRELIQLYRARQPYREPAGPTEHEKP